MGDWRKSTGMRTGRKYEPLPLFSADDLAHHQRGAEHDLVAGQSLAIANWISLGTRLELDAPRIGGRRHEVFVDSSCRQLIDCTVDGRPRRHSNPAGRNPSDTATSPSLARLCSRLFPIRMVQSRSRRKRTQRPIEPDGQVKWRKTLHQSRKQLSVTFVSIYTGASACG